MEFATIPLIHNMLRATRLLKEGILDADVDPEVGRSIGWFYAPVRQGPVPTPPPRILASLLVNAINASTPLHPFNHGRSNAQIITVSVRRRPLHSCEPFVCVRARATARVWPLFRDRLLFVKA